MSYVEVTRTDEIAPGTMKSVIVNEKNVLITNIEGKYYAIGGKCTHMGGELIKGKLEGMIVTCPRHGSRFDVTTGKSLSGPKIGFIKLKTGDEPAYPIKIEGKSLWVDV